MTELRITITTTLPDDVFEQARLIAGIAEPLAAFEKAVPGLKVEHEVRQTKAVPATPRVPRKPRSDAGQPRGPRNGAEPPVKPTGPSGFVGPQRPISDLS